MKSYYWVIIKQLLTENKISVTIDWIYTKSINKRRNRKLINELIVIKKLYCIVMARKVKTLV